MCVLLHPGQIQYLRHCWQCWDTLGKCRLDSRAPPQMVKLLLPGPHTTGKGVKWPLVLGALVQPLTGRGLLGKPPAVRKENPGLLN
eukprot:9253926-Lingulodinium_polyedra.AAC.1